MSSVRYSPAVEAAIASVCPPRDAFDAPDFDAVEYLNSRFPDAESLAALPAFLEETSHRLRQTENDLLKEVEKQAGVSAGGGNNNSTNNNNNNMNSSSAVEAAGELRSTKAAVAQLYGRVEEIRTRAAQSEENVKGLVAHIRELDIAKTNLTQSINALRSVQLWMLQLQSLAAAFERRRYLQCHDALKEALKYSRLFEPQRELAKIKELNDKQQQLCRQIEYYIRNTVFGDVSLETIDEAVMAEACAVVDLMGEESIRKLRDRFIEKLLESYDLRFRRGTDDAKLERTERRYVFIRTLLDHYGGVFQNVFPRHWCVPQELCVTFCLRTKQELDYQLASEAAEGEISMPVLMFVLQKTIEVERELTHRLAWKEDFAGRAALPVYRYSGLILSAFKAHMYLYVRNEDRLMREALSQPLIGDGDNACPGWNLPNSMGGSNGNNNAGGGAAAAAALVMPGAGGDDDGVRNGATLPMAEDMFVFIRESLRRTVRIAQQDILLEMAGVWRKHLTRFAESAMQLVPNIGANNNNNNGAVSSSSPAVVVDLRRACILANTAELCQSTSRRLGEEVAERAEVSAADVGFEAVDDAFASLYSKAIQAIVVGTQRCLAPALAEYHSAAFIAKRVAGAFQAAGGGGPSAGAAGGASGSLTISPSSAAATGGGAQDEALLIRAMGSAIHDIFLHCAAVLAPHTLRFLLDKLAAGVIPRFTDGLYRLRRVPDDAVGLLRIDAAALEKIFLQLPNYNDPSRFAASSLAGYTRLVRGEFDVLHRALKVLQVDPRGDAFLDVYYELVLPEDRSVQNFVRLVELKGMRREEVRPWVARLSKRGVAEATRRDARREASAGLATGADAGSSGNGNNNNNNNNSNAGGGGVGGINFASLFSRDASATAAAAAAANNGGSAGGGGFSLSGLVGIGGGSNAAGTGGANPSAAGFNASSSSAVGAANARESSNSPTSGGNAEGTFSSKFANVATTIGFLNKFKKSDNPPK